MVHARTVRSKARLRGAALLTISVLIVTLIALDLPPFDSSTEGNEPSAVGSAIDHATAEVRNPHDDEEQSDRLLPRSLPGKEDGVVPDGVLDDDEDQSDRLLPRSLPGEEDGVVPDGVLVTVFDEHLPTVANLDPELLAAVQQAATDAADDGIDFYVTSGWRSPAYQNQLLREAIATYGSEEEASRWVATADTSAHVTGDAIDIGPLDAMLWLSEHGARYGLCQIYVNEPWHFELRPELIDGSCPPMYVDPTHDPRMRQ